MALNTNKQFENALKEKEQDIQFLMLEKKDLLERNSKLQSEVNKLKLKQNEKAAISVSAASELEELRTFNRILQQEKNEFVETIKNYKENKVRLIKKINILESENEKLSNKHNVLLASSKSDIDMRNSEIQILKENMKEVQSKYDEEKHTTAELKMQVVLLESKLDRVVAESIELQSKMSVVKEEYIEDENVVQHEISPETSSEADKSLPIPTHRKKVEDTTEFESKYRPVLYEDPMVVEDNKESTETQEDVKPKKKDQQKSKPKAKRGRKKVEKVEEEFKKEENEANKSLPIPTHRKKVEDQEVPTKEQKNKPKAKRARKKAEKVEENIETSEADKSLPIPTHRKKFEEVPEVVSEINALIKEESSTEAIKNDNTAQKEPPKNDKDQQKAKRTVKRGRKKNEKEKEEKINDADVKETKKTAPKKRRTTKKNVAEKVSQATSLETVNENDALQQGDAAQTTKVEASEEPKTKGKKTKTTKRKTAAKPSKSTASTKTYTIAEGSTSGFFRSTFSKILGKKDLNEKDDVSSTSSKQTTKKKKRVSDADFVVKTGKNETKTTTRVTRSRRK